MSNKKSVRVPVPLSEWPELDRNNVMVSRMTSDPQPTKIHLVTCCDEEILK